MPTHPVPVARTPANVPGDFYVAADQCISCGAPEAEAPGLIRFDDVHQSCFFYRQPVDVESTYRAVSAVAVCCAGALRYGGSDPDILRRLARLRLVNQCDVQAPMRRSGPLTVVTFADGAHANRNDGAMLVATRVAGALSTIAPFIRVSAPRRRLWRVGASFGYTWSSTVPGHNVAVRRADDGPGRWCIAITRRGAPLPGHAGANIDDALRALPEVSDRRWYSAADWDGDRHSEAYPL